MKMKMKVMKKDIVMIVELFSNISHDLKRTLKIKLGGIIYSGGVKFIKFQLVSKKFKWYLMLKYDESYILKKVRDDQGLIIVLVHA